MMNLAEVKAFGPFSAFSGASMPQRKRVFLDSNSKVISGPAECHKSSKESGCSTPGKLCLNRGGNRWEGNVFFDGRPLCATRWGKTEAKLVCKSLGFGRAKAVTRNSHFGPEEGPLKEILCDIASEDFSDCSISSKQVCLADEVVGVVCETEDEKMRREEKEEEEKEEKNRCLVAGMEYGIKIKTLDRSVKVWKQCQQFCQNEPTCTHFTFFQSSKLCSLSSGGPKVENEDAVSGPPSCEESESAMAVSHQDCFAEGAVCLGTKDNPPGPAKDRKRHEGNILVGGRPVCDDNWNLVNGRVVCRQLGFFGVQQITVGSHFGFTSGNFSMDDVSCGGNEKSLKDCLTSKTEDCYGGEAAGVVCDQREKAIVEAEERKIAECYVEDVTYWGSRINASLPNVTSAPKCQEECAKNANCTHFTFLPIDIADMIQDCGKICLRDGIRPNTGILTLNHRWVCDHGLSSDYSRALKIGRVICRQLGYLDVVSVKSGSSDTHTVALSASTLCKGDEERLEDCPNYHMWYPDYCNTLQVSCEDNQVAEGELLCELFSGPEQGTNKSLAAGAITGPKICDNATSPECVHQSGVCLKHCQRHNGPED